MATFGTTTKWALRYLLGASNVNEIDDGFAALAGDLDGKLTPYDEGLLASRPVSTSGTPGKKGRTYRATDDLSGGPNGTWYLDYGTGWIIIPSVPLDGSVSNTKLDASTVAAPLGLSDGTSIRRGKSIVTGAETRTNTAYGLMPTPDRVQNVVLPTDGLIFVAYQATWQESVNAAARAAIFLGANQLKVSAAGSAAPLVQEARVPYSSGAAADAPLVTGPQGLHLPVGASVGIPALGYGGDVTTGQIIGDTSMAGSGGVCSIFAAAGTYDVSVRFKASSGTVTANNRKLWVWTQGF